MRSIRTLRPSSHCWSALSGLTVDITSMRDLNHSLWEKMFYCAKYIHIQICVLWQTIHTFYLRYIHLNTRCLNEIAHVPCVNFVLNKSTKRTASITSSFGKIYLHPLRPVFASFGDLVCYYYYFASQLSLNPLRRSALSLISASYDVSVRFILCANLQKIRRTENLWRVLNPELTL